MYPLLSNLCVVEGASFIAAPSCGLYFSQLGAEVIRFDDIAGGPDYTRWPLAPTGASLYWEGLNKGKKSVALNLSSAEGRDLAIQLITATAGNGLFLTNYPASGFLSHKRLVERRADLITLRVQGQPDGGSAIDYTVNCAVGVPGITGAPGRGDGPVNHVLPAWDLVTGAYAAFALLAADRHRRETGAGQEICISLSDVAMATMGNLGQIAEVQVSGDRPRYGNDLFGAFGRDFLTSDGQRIMIAAITARQWAALIEALRIQDRIKAVEAEKGVSFAHDEGQRFSFRHDLNPIVADAVRACKRSELEQRFQGTAVCWGPYQSLGEALTRDERLSEANPVFSRVRHPSGLEYLTPDAPAAFSDLARGPTVRAPILGEHTSQVLSERLGMSAARIGDLQDRGVVRTATPSFQVPS